MSNLTGVTRTHDGTPLGGVTVDVFRPAGNVFVVSGISDGAGAFSVTVPDAGPYYISAYKDGAQFLSGITARNLMADTEDVDVPVGDGTTVKNLWTGTPTPDGVIVSARMETTKTADLSRLVISQSSDLSNPVKKTDIVAPDATYRIAKYTATGLQPNTEYFYGVEIDGVLDTATKGRFKTLPPINTPTSFRLALGCCSNHSAPNHGAWQAIRELVPRPVAFLHLGDITYADSPATDESGHVGKYDSVMSSATGFATRHQTMREIPTVYMYDDHDFGPNDSYGRDSAGAKTPYRDASISAFRRRVPVLPHSSSPTETVDHSFVVGRVKVIMSDLRADKWDVYSVDPGKTMMGAAQKQRFKDHITTAAAAGQYVVWCSSVSFVNSSWGPYSTEQTELVDHIKAAGMAGKVCVISGDAHSMAYHSGYDVATGGNCPIPVFAVGAMHSTYSTKSAGPYTVGPIDQGPSGTNTGTSNYGVMDVIDDGVNMTVVWTGKASLDDLTLIEYRFAPFGQITAVAPSRMSAPVATAGTEEADVTLSPPYNGGADITGYTVVSTPAGGVDESAGTTATTRTITGLTPGVDYTFTATATNPAGTSVASPASNAVNPAVRLTTKLVATGGNYTTPGDGYGYYEILANTDFNVSVAGEAEVFMIGGGGSGGNGGTGSGGGGGAGGWKKEILPIPAGIHAVTIGQGGAPVTSVTKGNNGTATALGALLSVLGGGAGATTGVGHANSGGSGGGGGAGSTATNKGLGTAGQGHDGGTGYPSGTSSERGGAGGGGATGPGQDGSFAKGGNGGPGIEVWGKRYGGGGAGAGSTVGVGVDGATNGGNSTTGAIPDATPNTGGGGGGMRSSGLFSGKGAAGVVVIRVEL